MIRAEIVVVVEMRNGANKQANNSISHTGKFPMGVGHRVENGLGLTKVAVVLLNGLIW